MNTLIHKRFILIIATILLSVIVPLGVIKASKTNKVQQKVKEYTAEVKQEIKKEAHEVKEGVKDAGITAQIKEKHAVDAFMNIFKVKVSTSNGIVSLEGEANTLHHYERLISLAYSIPDVKEVDTRKLKIRSIKNLEQNLRLSGKIKGLLLKKKFLNDKELRTLVIEADGGHVYVAGYVSSTLIKRRSELVAFIRALDGVKEVHDHMGVEPKL